MRDGRGALGILATRAVRRFRANQRQVPELTRSVDIRVNERVSLRRCAVSISSAKRKSASPRSASAIDKYIGVPNARAEARSQNVSALVNFDAPAVLRKWPSLHNERRTESPGPYLLVDGTVDECIREFLAKPTSLRHLYEIHTAPQPPLVGDILTGEHIVELARLRDFL
jgi:hypothetical protein